MGSVLLVSILNYQIF